MDEKGEIGVKGMSDNNLITDFKPPFKVGKIVTNMDIYKAFKCGNAGGMRYFTSTNTLVLMLDHTKSLYNDVWQGDILHYTGMGQNEDQTLTRENKTLAEAAKRGITVHLFEAFKKKAYTYRGEVVLAGKPYQEKQNDKNDRLRNVWIFPLKLVKFKPPFEVGSTVPISTICDAFGCSNCGGIRSSHKTKTVVLIQDYVKSLYKDSWKNGIIHYVGSGRHGDQSLGGKNKRLAESKTNGYELHFFEVFKKGSYTYKGVVELAGDPYQMVQDDDDGKPRKVWIFPLRCV